MLLRAIDNELGLLREAYSWRLGPKRHTRINRMSFEDFAADHCNKVVMGLFNDHLCAVYVFIETAPKVWEAHFTSRKDAPHADVFAGARTMVDWFHSQGAVVTAEIVAQNRPLRAFVETLGFTCVENTRPEVYQGGNAENIPCQNGTGARKIPMVKYQSRLMDNSNRTKRLQPETEHQHGQ